MGGWGSAEQVLGVASEVQRVEGGGDGGVQVRAGEPQAVDGAAHPVRGQLEVLRPGRGGGGVRFF